MFEKDKGINVHGCGYLYYYAQKGKSEGYTAFNDFWHEAFSEIARRVTRFMDVEPAEAPFHYERQFHSILCPVLDSLADWQMMEYRVVRNWKNLGKSYHDSHGFLDYLYLYNNQYHLLELKMEYFSGISGVISNHVQGLWNSAIQQVQTLNNVASDLEEYSGKEPRRLVLLVAPVYFSSHKNKIEDTDKPEIFDSETFYGLKEEIINNMSPTTLSYWHLPKNYRRSFDYGTDEKPHYYYYEGVFLILKEVD